MMICLLNTIVDSPARFSNRNTPNGPIAINEIESVYEWLMEEVAGIENAVPEHEDNNSALHDIKKNKHDWVHQILCIEQLQWNQPAAPYRKIPSTDLLSFVSEDVGPPPRNS